LPLECWIVESREVEGEGHLMRISEEVADRAVLGCTIVFGEMKYCMNGMDGTGREGRKAVEMAK
jgi:hypothetical protein